MASTVSELVCIIALYKELREELELPVTLFSDSKAALQIAANPATTKILAHELVHLQQQIVNLQGCRAQVRGIETHTQALYASTSMSTGMKGATKAMTAMNKQMAPAKQVKVIREFRKLSSQLDMTVLDEIGVGIASQLSAASKGRVASNKVENVVPPSSDRLPMLRNLRRGWRLFEEFDEECAHLWTTFICDPCINSL
ncbi:Vacuolar protein sorting-associated protein 2 -like protein 3 [Capsicum baccatum]|uniref:Vacuolar protein sorting-associated protein 2-like protein 3 n=1 Tax=Capsicum baccatum TaxID=33114 RepID=A0A2G2XDJ5_CAPBA|nr:Vacuolar protein sorting-associated protein 2 -like protein 3 [Capsicum baccatum]